MDQSNGSANLDNMFDKNNRPNAPGPNNKYWDDSPDQDHSRGSLTDESSMSGGLSVTGNNQSINQLMMIKYGNTGCKVFRLGDIKSDRLLLKREVFRRIL